MPIEKELKVIHAKEKVTIEDHVLQEGFTPAVQDPAANIRAFQAPGPAPMPPSTFNMGSGGKLPSEDPMAFAKANPNFPYDEPHPGTVAHEFSNHNNFGQGKMTRAVLGSFEVEIPEGNPLFANFYHAGLRKYVSRKFSKQDHGSRNYIKNITDFVHNPNNSWFTHGGGWMHPDVSTEPHFELI